MHQNSANFVPNIINAQLKLGRRHGRGETPHNRLVANH